VKKKIFSMLFTLVLVLSLGLMTLVSGCTPSSTIPIPVNADVGVAPAQAPVDLGSAGNFVILAKSGISTTGTTSIVGDIGVSPIAATAITGFGLIMDSSNEFSTSDPSSLVTGKVYAADYAVPTPAKMTTAVLDMEAAYTDAAGRTLPDATELGAGNIGGLTLAPGLYKWSSGVTIPTDVTLSGGKNAVWIFQIAGTLDISSATSVILSGGAQAKNIFWAVADVVALGTTSVFNGNILAKTNITMTDGATLNGRALAQTAVTLIANTITVPGGTVPPLPSYGSIKVTGGGQISVPNSNSDDANATGTGKATFGFNAQPDKKGGTAKGHFNYVNHVTGLHINGSVDKVWVIAENADGSPKTVLFSGTYKGGSFIVTVEDRGEPGKNDQFGITVIGSQSEERSMRVISNGNIQFHK
jgi:hypothetical protein